MRGAPNHKCEGNLQCSWGVLPKLRVYSQNKRCRAGFGDGLLQTSTSRLQYYFIYCIWMSRISSDWNKYLIQSEIYLSSHYPGLCWGRPGTSCTRIHSAERDSYNELQETAERNQPVTTGTYSLAWSLKKLPEVFIQQRDSPVWGERHLIPAGKPERVKVWEQDVLLLWQTECLCTHWGRMDSMKDFCSSLWISSNCSSVFSLFRKPSAMVTLRSYTCKSNKMYFLPFGCGINTKRNSTTTNQNVFFLQVHTRWISQSNLMSNTRI